jgi:hypothetical protein
LESFGFSVSFHLIRNEFSTNFNALKQQQEEGKKERKEEIRERNDNEGNSKEQKGRRERGSKEGTWKLDLWEFGNETRVE